ncbi:MAG: endonuclease/exonuclease/phosphatase family protein [Candidatus Nomurabacteria bacterium]|nr:endonuclease/exonuclease/phosphatase family protein [Candidatus Nomurabacteria bacterium]
MKIITLNIAGRTNFGRGYQQRMQNITDFLSDEGADVVCLQEVTFKDKKSLADIINSKMKKPYDDIYSIMSEKYSFDHFSSSAMENWKKGLFEHADDFLTDGLATMSRIPIKYYAPYVFTPAPKDGRGRPDFRVRATQYIELETGTKITNVHFATNNNAYMQLDELINRYESDIIVGDFNMTRDHILAHKNIWADKYKESTDFENYISFPNDGVAWDHLMLADGYRFVSIRPVDGLSDHSAIVFEVEKK